MTNSQSCQDHRQSQTCCQDHETYETSSRTSSESHYRRQADMCRSEALLRRADPATSAQWLKIAAEYDKLAASAAAMTSRAIAVAAFAGQMNGNTPAHGAS